MTGPMQKIQNYVWRRVGVRKFIVGRDRVNDLVEAAVANWDGEAVSSAKDKSELKIVAAGMIVGIKRTHEMLSESESNQEYGFIWVILLQALVGAIVQILIKWWLESAKNRVMMWAAKKELVG